MKVLVEPRDFKKCEACGEYVLIVTFWDEEKRAPREILVNADMDYEYTKRDLKGRLVVWEKEKAKFFAHSLGCKELLSSPPSSKDEDKTWGR